MKCKILHSSKGRIRVHMCQRRMTRDEADILYGYLNSLGFVDSARVYQRTGDAVISFSCDRTQVTDALASFRYENVDMDVVPVNVGARKINEEYGDRLVSLISRKLLRRLFLPAWYRNARTVVKSLKYISKGLKCIAEGRFEVDVLDAVSIGVSIARGDYETAGSVMFLLKIGEILDEWTHKKSVNDLAQSMSLNINKVWLVTDSGDVLVPVEQINPGDRIRVHAGNPVPVDGTVYSGEATVNQASLTGESLPVLKTPGSTVYAGTVVEDGECVFTADASSGQSRYDRIIQMIEEADLNSDSVNNALHLADKLVPYSLIGTILTYALTRNATRAVSILMVDFSCALKLAMPLSFLGAMSEAGKNHITVKGGKFLEMYSQADTIVFDKTGTLTKAMPKVHSIVPFNGETEEDMIKVAACLEEHFPHSMANAVVKYARDLGYVHDERHSEVQYIVAHGIATTIDGKKAIIGSQHFVFEDEHCIVPAGEEEKFNAIPDEFSHLYLAIGGVLSAVVNIRDPLRKEAKQVVADLRKHGFSQIVMMTGDSEKTARSIARQVGVDRYYAEVLPEDKAKFVISRKKDGRKVVMIGDGINDTPALSNADVGIAISDGASIAREISDVIVTGDDLNELVILRTLSERLMERIGSNYRFIISFNGTLIALGALGILRPSTSAMLHNISTLCIALHSMTKLLNE